MTITVTLGTPGTYTVEDDGIRGNGLSVVRDSAGAIVATITHTIENVSFICTTPGITLVLDVPDLFAANFSVGSLLNSAECPDAIVVKQVRTLSTVSLASNGAITEGGVDSPADIIAGALILSAEAGIGTAGNAIETQVSIIEGETQTGGINLVNAGGVQIGGLSTEVDGLDVVSSGNLFFTTTGFITLADATGPEMVHGGDLSGNVTLTALGADSDISASFDRKMVTAAGGGITINAGRDFTAGTGGASFDNDILATAFINIHAGRDVLLDGTANIRTGAFGPTLLGEIVIEAGRNVALTNTTGGLETIETVHGDLVISSGAGGSYTQDATLTGAVTGGGDIFLSADKIALNKGFISSSTGAVTIRPVTDGRAIDIGSETDLQAALSLFNAELNRISTGFLTIGDQQSGPVELSAPLSVLSFVSLTVFSATEIFVRSSIGLPGALTLRAGDGVFLSPGAGFDGAGAFTAFVDEAQDDGGAGGVGILADQIFASAIALSGNVDDDALSGSLEADTLLGLGGSDTLQGRDGNDTLDGGTGVDVMTGGLGDDTYLIDSALDDVNELAGEGRDRVLASVGFTLDANVEDLTLLTAAGAASGTGNAANNTITGNASANTLTGLAGADILNGAGGNDIMQGGAGDDRYIVDGAGDQAVETSAADGIDLVSSSVAFTLGANVENLTLTGAAAINATGNTLANSLTGNAAANTLNGLGGADVMRGGDGNDGYVVDNVGDQVLETSAAGGTDTVQSSVSFTLGANVERLTLTGAAAINAIGNTLANILTGSGAANILNGLGGVDTMDGGNGNDTYIVDIAGDQAIETSAVGGTDLVQSSAAFTLGANIENLTLTGAAAINGTGNTLANTINGNGAANVLDGKAGADSMRGGDGNDNYIVDNVGDQAIESSAAGGSDRVQSSVSFTLGNNVEDLKIIGAGAVNGTGNALANTLVGNAAANQLNGLTGNDTLQGGGGADGFRFTTALGATNVDRILDMQVGVDDIVLENAVFTTLAAGALPASAFRTGATAGDADDRIIYDPATGALFYDADGNGGAFAAVRFATLQTGLALAAGDFEVI